MASEINRAYHAQLRKAQYKLIGHAIKSNSEQAMRNRDPDYLGTVINPVNAGPRVFFWTKDEARVPWSSLINVGFENRKFAGAGVEPSVTGAMATPAGRSYAKKQLERKALDLEMIRSMIPMPVEGMAQAAAQLDDVQRRLLEVSLNFRQASDALDDGTADSSTVEGLRKSIPSLVDLVPSLTPPQIVELKQAADTAIETGRYVPDAYSGSATYAKARDALTVLFRKIGSFLSSMVEYTGQDTESRRTIARNVSSNVFKRDQLDKAYAEEDIPANADDADLMEAALEDEDTAPVRIPRRPIASSAASAAAAADEVNREKLDRYLTSGSPVRLAEARKAYNSIIERWNSDPALRSQRDIFRLIPKEKKGSSWGDGRYMSTLAAVIKKDIELTGRYPTAEFADAVRKSRLR